MKKLYILMLLLTTAYTQSMYKPIALILRYSIKQVPKNIRQCTTRSHMTPDEQIAALTMQVHTQQQLITQAHRKIFNLKLFLAGCFLVVGFLSGNNATRHKVTELEKKVTTIEGNNKQLRAEFDTLTKQAQSIDNFLRSYAQTEL